MSDEVIEYADRSWNARIALHVAVVPAVAVGFAGVAVLTALDRPDQRNDPAAIAVVVGAGAAFLTVWFRATRSYVSLQPNTIVIKNPYRVVTLPIGPDIGVDVRALSPKAQAVRFTYGPPDRRRRVTAIAVPSSAREEVAGVVATRAGDA